MASPLSHLSITWPKPIRRTLPTNCRCNSEINLSLKPTALVVFHFVGILPLVWFAKRLAVMWQGGHTWVHSLCSVALFVLWTERVMERIWWMLWIHFKSIRRQHCRCLFTAVTRTNLACLKNKHHLSSTKPISKVTQSFTSHKSGYVHVAHTSQSICVMTLNKLRTHTCDTHFQSMTDNTYDSLRPFLIIIFYLSKMGFTHPTWRVDKNAFGLFESDNWYVVETVFASRNSFIMYRKQRSW